VPNCLSLCEQKSAHALHESYTRATASTEHLSHTEWAIRSRDPPSGLSRACECAQAEATLQPLLGQPKEGGASARDAPEETVAQLAGAAAVLARGILERAGESEQVPADEILSVPLPLPPAHTTPTPAHRR